MNIGSLLILFSISLLSLSNGTYAQIYKCTVNGKTEYSQVPCAPDAKKLASQSQSIDLSPPIKPFEWIAEQERGRQAREAAFRGSSSPAAQSTTRNARSIDAVACERADRDVKIERMKSGKNADGIKRAEKIADWECGRTLPDEPDPPPAKAARPIPDTAQASPTLVNCDQAGCWDTSGNRYTRGAGNTMFGPNGACTRTATGLNCP